MNDKIFVSIASFADPELVPTITDLLKRADTPENLTFGICHQHYPEDEWDNLESFTNDNRFRILDVNANESKGACWARSEIQKFYSDEEYTLQLDSHHRFVKGWDTKLKSMLKNLQKSGHNKPLLTAYLPSYDPSNDPRERKREVWKMDFDRFTPEGVVFQLPSVMEKRTTPLPTRFFSAHFVFTLGRFNTEVYYDPNLFFHGEEITMAVRSYTHGYDLFIPHTPIAWHEYTRKGRKRIWDKPTGWQETNERALKRCRSLLGVDNTPSLDFGIYGFGKERTKKDYERYAGIRFEDRAVQHYTLKHLPPPNPTYGSSKGYEKSFTHKFRHCIDIHKDSVGETDWEGYVVVFENEHGESMYREDAYSEEIRNSLSEDGKWINLWREFNTKKMPHQVVVWPYANGSWGNKIVIPIAKE